MPGYIYWEYSRDSRASFAFATDQQRRHTHRTKPTTTTNTMPQGSCCCCSHPERGDTRTPLVMSKHDFIKQKQSNRETNETEGGCLGVNFVFVTPRTWAPLIAYHLDVFMQVSQLCNCQCLQIPSCLVTCTQNCYTTCRISTSGHIHVSFFEDGDHFSTCFVTGVKKVAGRWSKKEMTNVQMEVVEKMLGCLA